MPANKPHSFDWVVPGLLAAMGRPLETRQALEFLKDEGIDVVVSLTETPLHQALIEEFGIESHHLPVRDFAAPTAGQIAKFVDIVEKARRVGLKCVVHCLAGKGRTGTMLACYLVSRGRSARDAIDEIRRLRPGSIETRDQEDAVQRYAHRLRGERKQG